MSFRLPTLLWMFALLAAAMTTFGAGGPLIAFMVLMVWVRVWRPHDFSCATWLLIAVGLGALFSLVVFWNALGASIEPHRQATCRLNITSVAKAVLNLAARNGGLPPAVRTSSESAAAVSWRVAILPELDMQALYDVYRRDETWDSASNFPLAASQISVFACPSDRLNPQSMMANYFAVVGPHTIWPPDRGRRLSDIADKRGDTILLIESPGRRANWSKPVDLSFDEALALLTDPPTDGSVHNHPRNAGFFYKTDARPGLHVAFADGSVRFLALPLSPELASALLTADGGETIDDREFDRVSTSQLDYARIYAFALFLALALLPAWRRLPAAARRRP